MRFLSTAQQTVLGGSRSATAAESPRRSASVSTAGLRADVADDAPAPCSDSTAAMTRAGLDLRIAPRPRRAPARRRRGAAAAAARRERRGGRRGRCRRAPRSPAARTDPRIVDVDGVGDHRRRRVGAAARSSPAPSRCRRCRAKSCGRASRGSRRRAPAMPQSTAKSAVERRRAAPRDAAGSATTPTSNDCPGRQMQRDVAAVVDVGAGDAGSREERDQLVGDAPATAAIGGDEARSRCGRQAATMRRATGPRRLDGRASTGRSARSSGSSPTSSASTLPNRAPRALDRRGDRVASPSAPMMQVDRAVLEMPAAVDRGARGPRRRRAGAAPRPHRATRAAATGWPRPSLDHAHAAARRARRRAGARGPCGRRARDSRRGACVNSIGATIAGVGTSRRQFVRHARRRRPSP